MIVGGAVGKQWAWWRPSLAWRHWHCEVELRNEKSGRLRVPLRFASITSIILGLVFLGLVLVLARAVLLWRLDQKVVRRVVVRR